VVWELRTRSVVVMAAQAPTSELCGLPRPPVHSDHDGRVVQVDERLRAGDSLPLAALRYVENSQLAIVLIDGRDFIVDPQLSTLGQLGGVLRLTQARDASW
jgi:hypothetical protein